MRSAPSSVFTAIRARILFGIVLLTVLVWLAAITFFFPDLQNVDEDPLLAVVVGLGYYVLFGGFLWFVAWRTHLVKEFTLGERPGRRETGIYVLLAVPLVGVSFFGLYVLYLPLSYISPDFVAALLLEFSSTIEWRGDPEAVLAIGIAVIFAVVIGPVLEEILFRGFLLNRWWRKYGLRRAVIFSSLAFALSHIEVIGGFVFAVILSLIYIKTQSLIGPIIVHASNNAIVFLLVGLDGMIPGQIIATTIEEFRADWWTAAVGAVIGVPWLVWYCKRSFGQDQDNA